MHRLTWRRAGLAATLLVAAAAGSVASTVSAATEPANAQTAVAPSQAAAQDIIDTAVAAGDFTTLATALEAAGLVETLKGPGPFTVFAPTDAAFAALPAGTVEALLADVPALTDVLLYHVVDGQVLAADVVGLDEATSIEGSPIAIAVVDGSVRLNGSATVTVTDIVASNGVIHVIDRVLLPPTLSAEPAPPATGNAGLAGTGSASGALMAVAAGGVVLLALGSRYAVARVRSR